MALLFRLNRLMDGEYAEVYAGGAAVALSLLFGDYARRIYINDLDRGVHAFWVAARDQTDELCDRIRSARLNMREWERQQAVQLTKDPDPLDLAYSTFYMNRTNRSGIIMGGVIGGRDQTGKWKLDARFNRNDLIRRIQCIGRWRSRIEVSSLNGAVFLRTVVPRLPTRSLVYLDPPYYVKGKELLYANYYAPDDHEALSKLVGALGRRWVVSYDDVPEVRTLYKKYRSIRYGISYSAHERYVGREVAFFSHALTVPAVTDPAAVSPTEIPRRLLKRSA